jgi:hypothetical protein
MLDFLSNASIYQNRTGRDGRVANGQGTWWFTRKSPSNGRSPGSIMPSLFRFLVLLGLVSGGIYGTVFALANFVKYHPREIIVTVPPDKFIKQQE